MNWCWLLHKWGEWKVTERFAVAARSYKLIDPAPAQIIGDGIKQERQCDRCKKVEINISTTTV